MAERTCNTCGGDMAGRYRSARYCGPCALARYGPRGTWAEPRTCEHCASPYVAQAPSARYCSQQCARAVNNASRRAVRVPDVEARAAARPYATCSYCGSEYQQGARPGQRFCSASCQVRHNQGLRRARRRGLPAEDFPRMSVFERDRWTCHLCGASIDASLPNRHPMSASIDHVVPLADPTSPGHVMTNCAASHLRCNLSKGAGALAGR